MARIVIVGAGTSGLVAAIALARRRHEVTLFDKDASPPTLSAGDDFARWHRPGTPQAMLPHGFMPLARLRLRERAPDLLVALHDAGAIEFDLSASMPAPARPCERDDELRILFCRRALFESTLWRAAEREAGIGLRTGAAVQSLVVARDHDDAPSVVGVRTADGVETHADLVVDAGGRRSPFAAWLRNAGIAVADARVSECGLVYYSRYYALVPGGALPRSRWLWGPRAELPYAVVLVHLADRGVFSITFGVPTRERDLRELRDSCAFTAACAALPAFAPWIAPTTATPLSEVLMMGGLQNVLEPVSAPGVVRIGDALCHTNAAYGWGVALGIEHAFALCDAVDQHGGDARAIARDHDARVGAEVQARWRMSSEMDQARTAMWRGEPFDPDAFPWAARLRVLNAAAASDADVFRAVMRVTALLDPAAALLTDDALLERARAAAPPPPGPAPPTRDQLLGAMRAACA